MNPLETIVSLSHEFGTADYVKGGGGNTSCKSADTLWVKPSGTTLSGLAAETFVRMSRAKLGGLYGLAVPAESAAREALVKDVMAAAVLPGQGGRPSVEAPLHDVLSGTFVVHTHPALVNGMTCAARGAEVCARLFPAALWVPYIDPGYTLCMDVRRRVLEYAAQHGRQPAVLVLENHGIFVTGSTAPEIRETYGRVMDALRNEYRTAGVQTALAQGAAAPADRVEAVGSRLRELLGAEAAVVAYGGAFSAATGPISPDHIVYSKAFPYTGALTGEGIAAFRKRHGYTPLVYVLPEGVFAIGVSQKKADLALELAKDGALILQVAEAFGGVRYMSDRARLFIENWEVESYRQKQM
jgi:rhamnose utilization protein RhaD (predicted bifunctional aldolase and dehydrogenase)